MAPWLSIIHTTWRRVECIFLASATTLEIAPWLHNPCHHHHVTQGAQPDEWVTSVLDDVLSNTWQMHLKRERVCLGSQFEVTAPVMGTSWWQELEEVVTRYLWSRSRELWMLELSLRFPFYTAHDPSPRNDTRSMSSHRNQPYHNNPYHRHTQSWSLILTIIIRKRVIQAGK